MGLAIFICFLLSEIVTDIDIILESFNIMFHI